MSSGMSKLGWKVAEILDEHGFSITNGHSEAYKALKKILALVDGERDEEHGTVEKLSTALANHGFSIVVEKDPNGYAVEVEVPVDFRTGIDSLNVCRANDANLKTALLSAATEAATRVDRERDGILMKASGAKQRAEYADKVLADIAAVGVVSLLQRVREECGDE